MSAFAVTNADAFQDPQYFLERGDSLFESGNYKGAAESYEAALNMLAPYASKEYIFLGMVYMQLGSCYRLMDNFNTALLNYYQAVEMAKRGTATNRGDASRILFGAYSSILDIYDNASLTEPMLEVTDDLIDFILDYKEEPLSDDVISEANLNNSLAYCYAQKGENLDEALSLVESAIKDEPDNYTMLDTKGWVLYKMGKKDEAEKILERALKLCDKEDEDCFLIERHLSKAAEE
jgi:tetratricopeptide (TPR) repeat protein